MSIRANRSFWPTILALATWQISWAILLCLVLNHAPATGELSFAIIGAGHSGLSAMKHLKDLKEKGYPCRVVLFEQKEDVGGVWYTNIYGRNYDGEEIYDKLFKGVRTSLPKQVMELPDLRYPETTESFLEQKTIYRYLQNYTKEFKLDENPADFRMSTRVTKVSSISGGRWEITSEHSGTERKEKFDRIFVCSGHFSTPYVPDIPGMEKFNGEYIHSTQFQTADDYKGRNVLVAGGGFSGTNLAIILSQTVEKVTISQSTSSYLHGIALKHSLPKNCFLVGRVEKFQGGKFHFGDKKTGRYDTVIFATGYQYDFPFLDRNVLKYKQKSVVLYRKIINSDYPTMAIIGIHRPLIPVIDLQVRFAVKFLTKNQLPSKEDMAAIMELDKDKKYEYPSQDYADELSGEAEITNIPLVVYKIVRDVIKAQIVDPAGFFDFDYRIVNGTTCLKRRSAQQAQQAKSFGQKCTKFIFNMFVSSECSDVS